MSRRLCAGLGIIVVFTICIMLYDFRITLLYTGQTLIAPDQRRDLLINANKTGDFAGTIRNPSVTSHGTASSQFHHHPPLHSSYHGNNISIHADPSFNTSGLEPDITTNVPFIMSNHPHSYEFRVPTKQSSLNVLLLSYQRSGSTIISSLFGADPNIFFVFEPLDALYNAIYGTAPGWNVPADITIKRDGSLRSLPSQEREAISDFMGSIYSCDFQHVPMEYLVHPFWWYFKNWTAMALPYVKCLRSHGLTERSLGTVQHYVRLTCGQRFGDNRSRQNRCLGNLWPDFGYKGIDDSLLFKGLLKPSNLDQRPFQHYSSSLTQLNKKVASCAQTYLTDVCKSTKLRAMKTVRANMDTAQDLLEKDPALKVVHLLRDPRGATRSRVKATWSRGFYEGHDIGKTAHVYCATALSDVKIYRGLKKKYPDRVMQVVLEEFMSDPTTKVQEIYNFLGLKLEQKILTDLRKKSRKGFVDKWKKDLDKLSISKINAACSGLLEELGISLNS